MDRRPEGPDSEADQQHGRHRLEPGVLELQRQQDQGKERQRGHRIASQVKIPRFPQEGPGEKERRNAQGRPLPEEIPADPEHHHADPRQQQGHDQRRRNGGQEELFQEIGHETPQKTHSPVSFADMDTIEEEQVLLLAAHQVIRVGEQEKGPRSQESQDGGHEAGTER